MAGNVRELQNALLRATLNSSGMRVTVEDFPPLTSPAGDASGVKTAKPSASNGSAGENGDSDEVMRALRECQGNVGRAARMLRIHRSTLYRRMEKLGIAVNQ